jgi:hypothetical protein
MITLVVTISLITKPVIDLKKVVEINPKLDNNFLIESKLRSNNV